MMKTAIRWSLTKVVISLFLGVINCTGLLAQDPYITVWNTGITGIDANQIIIHATGDFDYTWLDLDNPTLTGSGAGSDLTTIFFPDSGVYELSIYPVGENPFNRIILGYDDAPKLLDVKQWGDVAWSSFGSAYTGSINLFSISAIDTPNIANVTDMSFAFYDSAIDSVPTMSTWDMSNITTLAGMFALAENFNQPLNNWDVSSVTDMYRMFEFAEAFNQPLNSWDVSNVILMAQMFYAAQSFNYPLDDWNVSNVVDMRLMFGFAAAFNQPIDNWDMSNVLAVSGMFAGAASFNQPLGSWNMSNKTDLSILFASAVSFNQPINTWNVSSATDMSAMFSGATSFNQPLNNWDVSNVTITYAMFNEADSFNQPINNWDVSSVINMRYMFARTSTFNQPLNNWDVTSVLFMAMMFLEATAFNQPLEDWDVSNLLNTRFMFAEATAFNQPLGHWNIESLILAEQMLSQSGVDCENYSHTLEGWANNPNTPTNVDMSGMYGMEYSEYVQDEHHYLNWVLEWILYGDEEAEYCDGIFNIDDEDNFNVGVENQEGINLTIYPNPAHDKVNITGLTGSNRIELIDLSGRILQKHHARQESITIDLSKLEDGLYLITVTSETGKRAVKKVVKE